MITAIWIIAGCHVIQAIWAIINLSLSRNEKVLRANWESANEACLRLKAEKKVLQEELTNSIRQLLRERDSKTSGETK